jgi:hypothetical protein
MSPEYAPYVKAHNNALDEGDCRSGDSADDAVRCGEEPDSIGQSRLCIGRVNAWWSDSG